jgi:hypothetical protein
MVERYFEKFPIVNYSNNEVIDITRRTAILERVQNNPYVFYPYEISSEERADQFSYRYYKDSYYTWLVYMSNKIVDPYYGWYLNGDEFINFITKKYGSLPDSQQKIFYYKNNWERYQESYITGSTYNSLTPNQKSYWVPVYATDSTISSYKRAQIDWQRDTNKSVAYVVNATPYQLQAFQRDEIVSIVFEPGITGNGQFVISNTEIVTTTTIVPNSVYTNTVTYDVSRIYLQHMRGYFSSQQNSVVITANSYLYGTTSGINVAIDVVFANTVNVAAVRIASDNISDDIDVYYDPVTYYDYEYAKNEYNKTIKVFESSYAQKTANELQSLLNNEDIV